MEEYQELCGAMHLHTPYSDGNSSFSSYAQVGAELGLDFMGINDHMSLNSRDIEPGVQEGVIFLIGYEHNDAQNENHCLVYNTPRVASGYHPREYLDSIAHMGGYTILAHPEESRHYFSQFPALPWTEWGDNRFQGIEIWNQFSIWVENLKSPLSVINILFPRRMVKRASRSLLVRWDTINRERFVAGIGGVDAHNIQQKIFIWTKELFPLKIELKGIRQHFYIPSAAGETEGVEDKEELLRLALIQGNGFTSNYRRGDARGTEIFFRHADGTVQVPGVAISRETVKGEFVINLSLEATVRIVRNGEIIARISQVKSMVYPLVDSGSYRIEVRRHGMGWIYSNHFPLGSYPFG